ncbi:glycoside hydrolase family 5 protein [Ceraceosorus bombacis]|uniref:Glycoside hydrolase family 5 protein n=1 Tax=Ceraceosorus bombacis TaxID=401625 RepID=A0A0P1BGE0_9BASI|nr:glycoside hydrolase family 5 protein [Ceraceosorus bombacis]
MDNAREGKISSFEPLEYAAHDLSNVALGSKEALRVRESHVVDGHGRVIGLRGLNVSGGSKLPKRPETFSHIYNDDFWKHRSVDFVGRPFSVEDAPTHFARLQEWGHPLIRFLVTWESLAHSGPFELDHGYIAYLKELFELMPKYGIKAVICAHQDVWSRFSGGSGAPGWTFEAAGLDIRAFKETGAAYVHSVASAGAPDKSKATNSEFLSSSESKEVSGPFVWPSGYQKLAASTMATLFWAGDVFAWQLQVSPEAFSSTPSSPSARPQGLLPTQGEVSIQTLLQASYLHAFGTLADTIGDLEACLGFEPMNEPHRGLIGLHSWGNWKYETDLHIGHFPNALQSFALGAGHAQIVPYYVKSWPFPTRVSHKSLLDPKGKTAWLKDSSGRSFKQGAAATPSPGDARCLWARHGAWAWDRERSKAIVLREDFFTKDPRPQTDHGKVEWYRDCWAPFVTTYAQRIRQKHANLLLLSEPIPNEYHPLWPSATLSHSDRENLGSLALKQDYATKTIINVPRPEGFVFAPHFYDLNVLFSKVHSFYSVNVQGASRGMFILKALYFGAEGLRKNYEIQLKNIAEHAFLSLGKVPVMIGEVGMPFDVNHRLALTTGDYSVQSDLMDALIGAMEKNLLGYTLWNYNPDNTVEHGDNWLSEDFSVFCDEDKARDKENYLSAKPLYKGGRALNAILRPYAAKTAGIPLSSEWDSSKLIFKFRWKNHPDLISANSEMARTSEFYLPRYWFEGTEFAVKLTDGSWVYDSSKQSLYVRHANDELGVAHVLIVQALPGQKPRATFPRPSGMSIQDWTVIVSVVLALLVALYIGDRVYVYGLEKAKMHPEL